MSIGGTVALRHDSWAAPWPCDHLRTVRIGQIDSGTRLIRSVVPRDKEVASMVWSSDAGLRDRDPHCGPLTQGELV